MASLEDQVSAFTLVVEIREGRLKKDVIKKYKTSEQELAKMLHPLYKSGEITKEEFNDFFKGNALRKEETPPSREDDAPSKIFRALTEHLPAVELEEALAEEVVAKEVREEVALHVPPPPHEEPAGPPPVAEVVAGDLELDEELELEPEIIEDIEPEAAAEPAPPAPQASVEPVVTPVASPLKAQGGQTIDSAGLTSFLQQIFAKLSSIDDRLAQLEKKIGS